MTNCTCDTSIETSGGPEEACEEHGESRAELIRQRDEARSDLAVVLANNETLVRACRTLGATLSAEITTMQAASIDERLNPGSGMAWIDNSLLEAWTYPDQDSPGNEWDGAQSALEWFDERMEQERAHRRALEAEDPR